MPSLCSLLDGSDRPRTLGWAQRPNIEIRVLPFDVGLHSGMSGAFALLNFPEGMLPDAGWQEYALGGHIIDDPADVASLSTLYGVCR